MIDRSATRRLLLTVLTGGIACFAAAPITVAQDFPSRPVTIVVPFPPGGASDSFARVVAEALSPRLGQAAVVENRAGAAGATGSAYVARAKPDGYTILIAAQTQYAALPAMKKNAGYDPVKNFAPLSLSVRNPPIWLVVNPSVPIRSLPELIAYAKANPGKLKFGSDGIGTSTHVPVEQLKRDAGIDIVHVPFNGTGQMLPALLGGHVDMAFMLLPSPLENIKSGKLIPIASAGQTRAEPDMNLKTIAEQGFPGFDYRSWYGFAAPAGTPQDAVDRLSKELAAIIGDPQVRKRLEPLGFEFVGSTPAEFGETIKREYATWEKIVREFKLEMPD